MADNKLEWCSIEAAKVSSQELSYKTINYTLLYSLREKTTLTRTVKPYI